MKNKGVALFIVLALLLLLSIGGAVVLLLAYNYTYTTKKQIERNKGFYLAEAGLHHAFWRIRNNADGPPPNDEPDLCSLAEGDDVDEILTIDSSRVTVNYKKTEEGSDGSKSADDKFEVKSNVTY